MNTYAVVVIPEKRLYADIKKFIVRSFTATSLKRAIDRSFEAIMYGGKHIITDKEQLGKKTKVKRFYILVKPKSELTCEDNLYFKVTTIKAAHIYNARDQVLSAIEKCINYEQPDGDEPDFEDGDFGSELDYIAGF